MNAVVPHGPGERVAIGAAGPRTAAELDADARRVAAHLSRCPPGAVVLICSDRYHFAAALLGAWAAGHALRLPPNPQPEAIQAVVGGADVRAFLHDREGAPDGTFIPTLLSGPVPPAPLVLPPLEAARVDLTTSGSTGAHQVMHKTGAQLVGEGKLVGELFSVGPSARVLATVPAHHIYGLLWGVLMPLQARAAMVREGPLHAEEIIAALARSAATHLVSVPAHLAALAAIEGAPPVAAAFSSGAPLPAATGRALRERHGWRVVEVYGSTETGGIGWREAGEQAWTPFPDAAVAAAEDGRLQLDSPRLDAGAPRPYLVPDRIELREGGRFALLGRVDGVVKVAGKRVSLREVEERLLALPGVRDVAAVAQPSPGLRGEEIWVAVAAPGPLAPTPEKLRKALSAWLEPVVLPRRIRVVDALPREATGKLRRERLLALFAGGELLGQSPRPVGGRSPPPPVAARPAYLDPETDGPAPAAAGHEARSLSFRVDPALRWFEGHFPDFPVLPGVAQLDGLVLRQVERLWPGPGALRAVRRLKFMKLIRPGERIVVSLDRDAARGTVDFAIDGPDGRCASGTLVFDGGAR